ncbi:LmeA family phospholipid-binding protein [Mycobacterium shimoidei]|uniref:LmeA family phospholipid-binding protein n=1 Tax=Mycobacterium shimoidei TaxID=29313 RepID=UPI000848F005|nr:DUF2993 domain-containing protein [Mycobacterium shimoidei]ODR11320.1 hypothetical protein BHQ16_18665 [Mycobacterium shimoidei]ORW78131.1 hypothetical protein AWC26_18085 [Mycobacterium shimoidei]
MTTPQGPSRGDGPDWTRPASRPSRPQPGPGPSQSPTQRIPQGGRPQPPRNPPPPPRPSGPPPGPPPRQPAPPRPAYPQARQPGPPPMHQEQATSRISSPSEPSGTPTKARRGFFANRTSLVLILVIVLLVPLAGLIGAELYARNTADSKVANAVQCEVEDSATASFATSPPVLWQYLTDHYTNISVETAGNQVRSAKGMKITLNIDDVNLNGSGDSKGTIGALNGTITWSADGIKESIQDAIPVLGSFVTSKVTTNPGAGTVELKGLLDKATVKPQIEDNGLSLQVVELSALGSNMSTDKVQKHLDELTSKATKNYPLGIHADTVKVTNSGVEATFSTQNATIPASKSKSGRDCFSQL